MMAQQLGGLPAGERISPAHTRSIVAFGCRYQKVSCSAAKALLVCAPPVDAIRLQAQQSLRIFAQVGGERSSPGPTLECGNGVRPKEIRKVVKCGSPFENGYRTAFKGLVDTERLQIHVAHRTRNENGIRQDSAIGLAAERLNGRRAIGNKMKDGPRGDNARIISDLEPFPAAPAKFQ